MLKSGTVEFNPRTKKSRAGDVGNCDATMWW